MYEFIEPSDLTPETFVIVVGNARSGTTIMGAILDSHPSMMCANETLASSQAWRGLTRDEILAEIVENCRAQAQHERPSEGYRYAVATPDKSASDIQVIGDKIFNPTLLLLAGSRTLATDLGERLGCAVSFVHCTRNPFDVVATMHRRSGASLADRLRWYTMHCEAAQMLIERGAPITTIRHEDLVADPRTTSRNLFRWLGYDASEAHLDRIADRVFAQPHATRTDPVWSDEVIRNAQAMIARFPFLAGYTFDG